MAPLHRHQLVRLGASAWRGVREREWDATASACLGHWADHDLPLVVTRQPPGLGSAIALGLPAPGRWDRRRLALQVPGHDVRSVDEFPSAAAVTGLLPDDARTLWRLLCEALGAAARVYGSYGWQRISGLDHVRAGSDIDVWVSVATPEQADAAAARMHGFVSPSVRLDGELVFAGGIAVAWREWAAWRAGRTQALLVKTLAGASMLRSLDDLATAGGLVETA